MMECHTWGVGSFDEVVALQSSWNLLYLSGFSSLRDGGGDKDEWTDGKGLMHHGLHVLFVRGKETDVGSAQDLKHEWGCEILADP